MFDYITLMHKGEIVYQGPGGETVNYFKDLDYECEPYNDHSRFFLDVIDGVVPSCRENPSPGISDRQDLLIKFHAEDAITSCITVDPSEDKNLLAHHFRQSALYQKINKEVKDLSVPDNSGVSIRVKSSYPTPFWYQLYILCAYTLKNLWRNPQTSLVQVCMMILFGILNGLIYYKIPHTMPEALQNRIGAFFFMMINQIFGNISAVEIFIQEKALFILSSLAAVSLAFLVSASVSTFATANALIAIAYVFMMVFGGFLVNLNEILQWLSWLKWISIFRYGLNALIISELKGQIFYMKSAVFHGEIYMIEQGIDYSIWGFWQNQVALLCIMTIFLFLSFIQLLQIDKWK